jgi:short-subunit dehydrogenase
MSSIASEVPYGSGLVYGATKAFNRSFSMSIAAEVPKDKVDVLCVKPGPVATPMTSTMDMSKFFWGITPKECVAGIARAFGRRTETYGHWKHEFIGRVFAAGGDTIFGSTIVRLNKRIFAKL